MGNGICIGVLASCGPQGFSRLHFSFLLAKLLGEGRARWLGLELVNYQGVWFSSGSLATRQVLPGRGMGGACLLWEYKRLY